MPNTPARRLRKNATDAESHLWNRLRARQLGGWKFRRQHRVGAYVVDFACVELHLAVEVDGGQHAGSTKDAMRSRRLESQGWRVIRFWNNDVLRNIDGVLTAIGEAAAAMSPSPQPSPPCRGRGRKESSLAPTKWGRGLG